MSEYALSYIDPDGMEYALNDGVNTLLRQNGMRGFGVQRVSVATQRTPYTQGVARLGGPYTPEREMQVALQLMASSYSALTALNDTLARNVSAYKDTETLGALKVVTPDGRTRKIDCWMVEWPDPELDGPFSAVVAPVFWAQSPWFYDPTALSETLALAGDGGITFPITFPITFGSTTIDSYVYPENTGDVETWPVIRVNGPGENIELTNDTTGKTVALTAGGGVTLDVDDYVTIDMAAGTVTWYDATAGTTTSVIAKLSTASEFWPLVRGVNTVHGEMTATTTGSIVFTYTLYYQSGR